MPFTIDQESFLIKGRQGDTASLTFNFSQNMSAYTAHFYVKKRLRDTETVIEKEYPSPANFITIELTSEDTQKLVSKTDSYSVYYWGLKITKEDGFAQTIVPKEFNKPPKMYVYPEIGV